MDIPLRLFNGSEKVTPSGDWRLATGDWRLATGDWRLATGDYTIIMVRSPHPCQEHFSFIFCHFKSPLKMGIDSLSDSRTKTLREIFCHARRWGKSFPFGANRDIVTLSEESHT